MITKIVAALDGSQTSADALGIAIDIASKYNAALKLVAVIPPVLVPFVSYSPTGTMPLSPIATGEYYSQMNQKLKDVLAQSKNKAQELNPNLKISSKLLEGRPADQIVNLAKEWDSDLVVVGQKGVGAIEGFILGSVSDRVADDAHCSVLIVKKHNT